jgi:hypothetical protein
MGMSIEAVSTAMSQEKLSEDVGAKVASIALDTMKDQGAQVQKLMESSEVITDPLLGTSIDTRA